MTIDVPISLGELFDKLSVLKIKLKKIPSDAQRKYVETEHDMLRSFVLPYIDNVEGLNTYLQKLEIVNLKIWDILERQRCKDSLDEFDDEFIDLSRQVYIQNDLRFKYKNLINEKTSSIIREQKFYTSSWVI